MSAILSGASLAGTYSLPTDKTKKLSLSDFTGHATGRLIVDAIDLKGGQWLAKSDPTKLEKVVGLWWSAASALLHGTYGIQEFSDARTKLRHGDGDRTQNIFQAVKGAGDVMTGVGHLAQGLFRPFFQSAGPAAFSLTLAGIGIATIASFGEILRRGE